MADFSELEIFVRVVAAQSMSAAARSLGITPAVVSKRIGSLEKALGVRLLHRTTRQVVPTEIGQGYYERVAPLIEGLRDAEVFVSGRMKDISGTLRISAPTSFGRMHIAPHLAEFMRTHPALSVDLVLSDSFTDIIAEGFDAAVRIKELADSGLVARKLASVSRILCASPDYLEEFGSPTELEDLNKHQCIAAHNGEPWRLEGPSGPIVFRPTGRLNTNSSEVVREAVISGLGIALRSSWDVGEELLRGRLVRVLPEYEGSRNVTVSVVYPSRQFLPAKMRAFIDFFAALYGPIPYWDRTP